MACPSRSPRRRAASAAPRKPRTSKIMFHRWARPAPAHRKKSRAMTREVKKAVTRIRRVQDAVYNNKVGICHSMSIHTNTLVRCDGEVMTWWTVFAHQSEPPAKACRSWTFADDSTAEDIEGILKELSEYIEHEV